MKNSISIRNKSDWNHQKLLVSAPKTNFCRPLAHLSGKPEMSVNFTLIVATVVHSVDPDGTHVMSVRPSCKLIHCATERLVLETSCYRRPILVAVYCSSHFLHQIRADSVTHQWLTSHDDVMLLRSLGCYYGAHLVAAFFDRVGLNQNYHAVAAALLTTLQHNQTAIGDR